MPSPSCSSGNLIDIDDGSTKDIDDDQQLYGPETEFVTECKRIFSPSCKNAALVCERLEASAKDIPNDGAVVAVKQSQRKLSCDEEASEGINLVEVISASVLELFFSTLPSSQQEKIRTLFVDVLNISGVSQRNVFSNLYESTRIKMARMMHDQIVRSFMSSKISNPAIDDRLTMEFPIIVSQQLTRYNEDFEEIQEIGAGGFGKVYSAKSKVDGQLYAIKKIPLKKTSEKAYQRMLEECRLLALLQHPNIVRYHNAWVDISYKTNIRVVKPASVRAIRIETLSTTDSSHPSTSNQSSSTNQCVTFEDVDDDNEKESSNSSEEEEEESTSSDESKGKGFWANKPQPAGDYSYSSFGSSTTRQDEDGNESEASNDSLDSVSAMEQGKNLAKNNFCDDSPADNLAVAPVDEWEYIGYPTLFIQMELCPSTLEMYIAHRQKNSQPIDPIFNEVVIDGLLSSIQFLHRNSIVHRDIKPSNIFLKQTHDKKPIVMLGDFGLARSIVEELALDATTVSFISGGSSKMTGNLGTALYASPEQLGIRGYSLPSDIYSAGVVIYELYHDFQTGYERVETLKELRKTGQLSEKFQQAWPELSSILSLMISKDPSKRLEAATLLSKFKEMKEKKFEQTEIQRLTSENQRLTLENETLRKKADKMDFWEQKCIELERRLSQLSDDHDLENTP